MVEPGGGARGGEGGQVYDSWQAPPPLLVFFSEGTAVLKLRLRSTKVAVPCPDHERIVTPDGRQRMVPNRSYPNFIKCNGSRRYTLSPHGHAQESWNREMAP